MGFAVSLHAPKGRLELIFRLVSNIEIVTLCWDLRTIDH
jgi:hypothetical protein